MIRFILFLAFAGMACKSGPGKHELPINRPADLKLHYHVDGGMQYYFEDLDIAGDSSVFLVNDHGHKIRSVKMLSGSDLDKLYQVLKNNQFDQIAYRTESKVYDRGGISIRLSWNKDQQWITVSDAQMSFVLPEWKSQWGRVCAYVAAIGKGKARE
ncbi:MAG: hypothetical protein IPI66_07675 [Chitinophagaceae bacterium]|nr:hypothetical protein [Chitinophagaceae bacterium]MBL0057128.1 hypothetical protein [Chitinophagaceae bacterium]